MNQSHARQNEERDQEDSDSSASDPRGENRSNDQNPVSNLDPAEVDLSILAHADFSWAIMALDLGRLEILASWLEAARVQPFHAANPERVVSDDIPRLYDAVVEYLAHASNTWRDPGSPMDYPAILAAANSHANTRAEQGLQPSDVVTEFRLLRRAIWKGLRDQLGEIHSVENLVTAELLVNDALDGAITVGLEKLSSRIEGIREDFLVSTIHDIRQPITAIKGLAQLSHRYLSRQIPEIERARTALVDIASQVDSLNGTIDFLIDVSRAALGQLSLQLSFIDLARLVPDVIEQDGAHQLRELRLILPDEGTATGYWDADRLRQVMSNLISNALKYAPGGSPIEVEVHSTTDTAEVLVRDFGMGLDQEELPKIFQRYYRTASAIKSDAEGSGIGLYLCAQIIEAHGGRIWAESDGPEHGTTIHFIVPRGTDVQSTQA